MWDIYCTPRRASIIALIRVWPKSSFLRYVQAIEPQRLTAEDGCLEVSYSFSPRCIKYLKRFTQILQQKKTCSESSNRKLNPSNGAGQGTKDAKTMRMPNEAAQSWVGNVKLHYGRLAQGDEKTKFSSRLLILRVQRVSTVHPSSLCTPLVRLGTHVQLVSLAPM